MSDILFSVNVDHIATVREARGGLEPDPVEGARLCEQSGAEGITVHLREDRRHIQDRDIVTLKDVVKGKYNLEMALSDEIIEIARRIEPDQITLVPEKRKELTTEGGLDVKGNMQKIKETVKIFHDLDVLVSLFIEPDRDVVKDSKDAGADCIEIHTGTYCDAVSIEAQKKEITRIYEAAEYAMQLGMRIHAGHGLNYENIQGVLETPGLTEVSIGHSIISKAVMVGLEKAVGDMAKIIKNLKD